ncbi:hypothetical protein SAMN05216207_10947 [Pseudonocardia ammonioxydans]|uniref:Uncharacterized protein n=1 Tax=Pseudonocardia ammonioxydans TaxID=260086 RepID=A0A1I5IAK3_PSUAM|nr:hypothetical protein [Pseudonocardia ammonioxydans]SFO57627.1 hypothetical protein SAMN05216207_10947 [Pseudonocardia ammonioxydans]
MSEAPTGDDDPDRSRFVVGLLTDPDLPHDVARDIAPILERTLPDELDGRPVSWSVVTTQDPFESLGSSDYGLYDKARERVRDTDWDIAIGITDVPIRRGRRTVLTEHGNAAVAVVSLPALGALNVRRRARSVITDLLTTMAERLLTGDDRDPPAPQLRPAGLARLVAGMVRANRPWAFTTGLARSLAGGLAGSAFGVLYPSIWTLADSMPPWRIAVTVVGATAVHAGWLVAAHRLWERRGDPQRRDRPSTGLRNASTLITVGVGVLAYTAVLFVLSLVSLVVIVTPEYLGSQLGHPVGLPDYLGCALMATVIGTVAGAIGSGLENGAAVRHAAYGHRTAERIRAG